MSAPKSARPSKRCRVCKRVFYKRPAAGASRWAGQETCGSRSCVSLSGHRNRGTYRKLVKHRCRLEGCDALVEPREGEWPSDYRSRRYHSDACAHAGRAKVRRERRVVAERSRIVLRVCELDGCEELIPCGEGVTPSDYARIRYHAEGCRNAGRAAKRRRVALVERECECGCGPFLPARKTRRFASASCAMRARNRGRVRETKVCECGCGTRFERPKRIPGAEWEKRRFLDAEHRRRAEQRPGEARAGKRKEPRCAPSKDRKPKAQPEPEPRKVFDGPPPAEPFRPGRIPVVERVPRPTRRPSFGLTRRPA